MKQFHIINSFSSVSVVELRRYFFRRDISVSSYLSLLGWFHFFCGDNFCCLYISKAISNEKFLMTQTRKKSRKKVLRVVFIVILLCVNIVLLNECWVKYLGKTHCDQRLVYGRRTFVHHTRAVVWSKMVKYLWLSTARFGGEPADFFAAAAAETTRRSFCFYDAS